MAIRRFKDSKIRRFKDSKIGFAELTRQNVGFGSKIRRFQDDMIYKLHKQQTSRPEDQLQTRGKN